MASPMARRALDDFGGFQIARRAALMSRYDRKPFRMIGGMRPSAFLPYSDSEQSKRDDLEAELAKRADWDMALADDMKNLPPQGL